MWLFLPIDNEDMVGLLKVRALNVNEPAPLWFAMLVSSYFNYSKCKLRNMAGIVGMPRKVSEVLEVSFKFISSVKVTSLC